MVKSAVPHLSGRVGLPVVVEELLADGFALYCCGPKTAPKALVASYERDHYFDLLTVGDFGRVTTARVPTRDAVDIVAPKVVIWVYEGPLQQALSVLLDLVHPARPDAPTIRLSGTSEPARFPRPATVMTIRPSSLGHAGVRAARLATAMTTHGGDRAVSAAVPAGRPGLRLATG